jgi:hypothetical protein
MSTYETNPVGALQERFQSRGINPVYQIIQAEGASHCPTFTFQVFIADLMASGSGNSKKQAKHAAARAMLDMLDGKERGGIYGSVVSSTTSQTAPVSIAVAAQVACNQVNFLYCYKVDSISFFSVFKPYRKIVRLGVSTVETNRDRERPSCRD